MAQCIKCEFFPNCDHLKHPSNVQLLKETCHNCQDFKGEVAGYKIRRVGGNWPEGKQVAEKM